MYIVALCCVSIVFIEYLLSSLMSVLHLLQAFKTCILCLLKVCGIYTCGKGMWRYVGFMHVVKVCGIYACGKGINNDLVYYMYLLAYYLF